MSLNSLGEDPEQSVLCVVDAHKAVTLGARWCFAGSRWRTTIPEFFRHKPRTVARRLEARFSIVYSGLLMTSESCIELCQL